MRLTTRLACGVLLIVFSVGADPTDRLERRTALADDATSKIKSVARYCPQYDIMDMGYDASGAHYSGYYCDVYETLNCNDPPSAGYLVEQDIANIPCVCGATGTCCTEIEQYKVKGNKFDGLEHGVSLQNFEPRLPVSLEPEHAGKKGTLKFKVGLDDVYAVYFKLKVKNKETGIKFIYLAYELDTMPTTPVNVAIAAGDVVDVYEKVKKNVVYRLTDPKHRDIQYLTFRKK